MRRWPTIALSVALLAAACDPDPLGTPALEAALATTRQAPDAAATAPGEPPEMPLRGADAHRMSIDVQYRLDGDDGRSTRLLLRRTIDRDGAGRFRIEEMRDWSDAQDVDHSEQSTATAIYDGRRFVVQQGWGPWRARDTWAGQHWEMLAGAYDVVDELFRAFEPYLEVTPDEGVFFVAGVLAKASQITLDTAVLPQRLGPEALAALRDHDERWVRWITATHQPQEVRGWQMRNAANGRPLVGQLIASGFLKDGTDTASYRLTLEASVGPTPPGLPIAIPARASVFPAHRRRLWSMIEDVLGDRLEPLYRRAARQP